MKRAVSYTHLDPVSISDFPEYPAGVSGSNNTGWNILCHHAACADYCVAANSDPGKDNGVPADPDIIANSNGVRVLQPIVPLLYVQRMSCGIKGAVWAQEDMAAKRYPGAIEDNTIMVGIEVVTDFDVVALSLIHIYLL